MNKKLAKIKSATLQIKERGILTFLIGVDYEEGGSQGVGGIALDRYCHEKETRVGTEFGCEIIRRLLLALNVDDFSEMKGKHVWVYGTGNGLEFTPKGIGPLNSDNDSEPVIFSDIYHAFV